ncbi:MAG: hypothetical protein JJT76_12360 [Clostridiaceae bacterium]|nr:hypothetical protein [Clostridiaceae bacterium]
MYHNPYHSPYHSPYQNPYHWMPEEYMYYYDRERGLMDMYPDIYRRVHPRVESICARYDVPTNPRMYPQVDPRMIEEMVDEIYRMETSEVQSEQWGRGPFRDLITILLIRQLLGRRRRRPGFGYPGVGYPIY